MKTLVVYFSRKGYAKRLAEEKAKETGGDLLCLETKERTKGFLGFMWCGRFGMHRWGMKLCPYHVDVAQYDKVILVSPVWVFTICAPIRQFAEENKKKVKAADYVLVHFSFPPKYKKTISWLDETLGVRHGTFTSVCCIMGKIMYQKTMGETKNASDSAC